MADETQAYSGPIVTRSEAKAAGLKRFFTGKPCGRAHIDDRWVSSSVCRSCAHEHAVRNYAIDSKAANARVREWEAANPDRVKNASKIRYSLAPEKIKARSIRYYADNVEKCRNRITQWNSANPDRVRAMKAAWRKKNKDRIRVWTIARRAMKRGAEGSYTVNDIDVIMKAQHRKCGYCRKSIKNGYHVDHIVALINGGTNWPRNLQLLCGSCNSRKNAKDPIVFAQQLGLLC